MDNRGSAARRSFDATAPLRKPIAFLIAGALLGIAFTPRLQPKAPVTRLVVSAATPTPTPSPSESEEPQEPQDPNDEPLRLTEVDGRPVVQMEALKGRGPFAIVGRGNPDATSTLFAFDLSQTESRTPYELGTVPGDVYNSSISQTGTTSLGLVTRSAPATAWVVARGSRALRRLFGSKDSVVTAALGSDGKELMSLRALSETSQDAVMWITTVANGASRRAGVVKKVRNPEDPVEDMRVVSWDAKTGRMLGIRACHCDGGMGSTNQYVLTPDAKIRDFPVEGNLSGLGVAHDGSAFVYTDLGDADCFMINCAAVERTLRWVSTRDRSSRVIARASRPTFDYPRLSPDGSLVAYGTGATIEVARVSDGRVVGAIEGDGDPLVWLDNRRLLTIGGAEEPGDAFPNVGMVTFGSTLRSMPAFEGVLDGSAGMNFLGVVR